MFQSNEDKPEGASGHHHIKKINKDELQKEGRKVKNTIPGSSSLNE